MILQLKNLGKKFARDWVIRDLNAEFKSPEIYAVKGPNGSGKSTLLKLIAGYLLPSKGEITWLKEGEKISEENQYKYLGVSAPYMQIVEELTLDEFLAFHLKFKNLKKGESISAFKEKTMLSAHGDKAIKDFSSGMKQRVKLGLCFYFENEIILIDEGSSNLDAQGVQWFRSEVSGIKDKLIILFSNQESEYSLANKSLDLSL